MRKTLLLIFTYLLVINTFAQCPQGYTVFGQSSVDNFRSYYPGCTSINGTLLIRGDVNNLNGFSSLEQITGDLRILDADSLVNLSGLGNLVSVGEHVLIAGNDKLTSTSSLNIETIGKNLEIYLNPKLSNILGFSNLNIINNRLIIHNNPLLTTLEGLGALKSVGENILINSLPITNLEGLSNLGYAGLLELTYLPDLTSFAGLPDQISVGGLSIAANNKLEDLSGLEDLDNIGTTLRISDNINLKDISSLNLVPFTGNTLQIYNNPLLADCDINLICKLLSSEDKELVISNNKAGCRTAAEVQEQCNLVTGNKELSELQINILPNPGTGIFKLQTIPGTFSQVTVRKSSGELVGIFNNTEIVDLSSQSDGIYFFEILLNETRVVQRVIKL